MADVSRNSGMPRIARPRRMPERGRRRGRLGGKLASDASRRPANRIAATTTAIRSPRTTNGSSVSPTSSGRPPPRIPFVGIGMVRVEFDLDLGFRFFVVA